VTFALRGGLVAALLLVVALGASPSLRVSGIQVSVVVQPRCLIVPTSSDATRATAAVTVDVDCNMAESRPSTLRVRVESLSGREPSIRAKGPERPTLSIDL
jgi:hypothetical protein